MQEIVQLQSRKHTLASHGIFNPETISRYVNESYVALYQTARLNQHLPALAERFTTDRLTALAQAKGTLAKPVPEILFLCVHKAGRSQMAAALMTHHAQGRVNVRSAGSAPDATVSASAAAVLTEIGIDLDEASPSHSPTTCCAPPTSWSPWAAATPAPSSAASATSTGTWQTPAATTSTSRAVRDDIDTRVRAQLADLTAHPTDR